MSRTRKNNAKLGLPDRVYIRGVGDSAVYILMMPPDKTARDPKDGKKKRVLTLGKTIDGMDAMLKTYNMIFHPKRNDPLGMPSICQLYADSRLATYSEETQNQYKTYLAEIAEAFEEFRANDVNTYSVAQFLAQFQDVPNAAKKRARLLSKVFVFAISKGLRNSDTNPLDNIDLFDFKTERRTVLITHEQVMAIRAAGMLGENGRSTYSGETFAAIIDMAYLTWQRAGDVRNIKEEQIVYVDGAPVRIKFKPGKTQKTSGGSVDMAITPAIADVIRKAQQIKRRRNQISPFLFVNRNGKTYAQQSLNSMWDRAKERAGLKEVDITFRDIRALAATDAARSGSEMEEIKKRLVHTTTKTSAIYIKEAISEKSELVSALPWA